jgi:hypothetical protein
MFNLKSLMNFLPLFQIVIKFTKSWKLETFYLLFMQTEKYFKISKSTIAA